MRLRALVLAGAAAACALVVPAAASAHAYLVKTVPAQSAILNGPPRSVQLTYDEAVEPRFATISVTDARGRELTTAPVGRSPADPDTLVVPLKPQLPQGWYLVYWRAISVDGHPVQGAYTFAIGPSPGTPPEFAVPHSGASATSTDVVVTRWLAFLSVLTAIGLFAFRVAVARPLVRRVEGTSLRAVSIAFASAAAAALVAVPVYLDVATSVDSLRSAFDVGGLLPLFRVSAFGRGFLDLELCSRSSAPPRRSRCGSTGRSGSDARSRPLRRRGRLPRRRRPLLVPALAGHAAQTSPRPSRSCSTGSTSPRARSGSAASRAARALVALPAAGASRRSRSACRGSRSSPSSRCSPCSQGRRRGHPASADVAALWQTGYGEAILVKAGCSPRPWCRRVNLLHTKPRLAPPGGARAGPPRRCCGARRRRVALVAAACSPRPCSRVSLRRRPRSPTSAAGRARRAGPGLGLVDTNGYPFTSACPEQGRRRELFGLRVSRGGPPAGGRAVTATFKMLAMEMPALEYQLPETSPGLYTRRAPALVMFGRWSLAFSSTAARRALHRARHRPRERMSLDPGDACPRRAVDPG